ncbi:hypothetical protein GCM10027080_29150 [Pedococcus soli]
MAPNEYDGPIHRDPPPPKGKSGHLEYEDEPCPKCGKPLLGKFSDQVLLGGRTVRQVGSGRECRNGCPEGRKFS